MTPADLNYHT